MIKKKKIFNITVNFLLNLLFITKSKCLSIDKTHISVLILFDLDIVSFHITYTFENTSNSFDTV